MTKQKSARRCSGCGAYLPRGSAPGQMFCNKDCRIFYRGRRTLERRYPRTDFRIHPRACGICGSGFNPVHPVQVYCSDFCRNINKQPETKRAQSIAFLQTLTLEQRKDWRERWTTARVERATRRYARNKRREAQRTGKLSRDDLAAAQERRDAIAKRAIERQARRREARNKKARDIPGFVLVD